MVYWVDIRHDVRVKRCEISHVLLNIGGGGGGVYMLYCVVSCMWKVEHTLRRTPRTLIPSSLVRVAVRAWSMADFT